MRNYMTESLRLFCNKPYSNVGSTCCDESIFLPSSTKIFAQHSEIERNEYQYDWNSDGLRSIEFSEQPEVVVLGCSHTLGQGLPVDKRWSDVLAKLVYEKYGFKVGNISYSGAAPMKNVSSFFGMINKYKYLPKIIVCNFANFERLWFVDSHNSYMRDYFPHQGGQKVFAKMPFNYENLIPIEWVYFSNFDHIKMLEVFCESNNIKLIWSSWSIMPSDDEELKISQLFSKYVPDPTRYDFPDIQEKTGPPSSIEEIAPKYSMKNWGSIKCHNSLFSENSEIFHHAYDYHKFPTPEGPGAHWPHFGSHRHAHWAEFYFELINQGL